MSARLILAAAFACAAASFALAADEKPAPAVGSTVDTSAWSAEVAPGGTTGITLDPAQTEIVNKVNAYFNAMQPTARS